MVMKRLWVALAAAGLVLAGCGGGGDGDQSPAVRYGKLVSFGDSLSDVGSYAVSGVAAVGGGKYTVNGTGVQIWVERLAEQLGVAAPCAAQTGLNATASLVGFPAAPVTDHAGCYGYAQGGARVTHPIGPANAATLAMGDPSGALGQLTDPIVNQMDRHLAAVGGSFAADDLVVVLAGGNDVFMQLATLSATVAAGGDATAAATAAVQAMATAGAELAGYIKAKALGKGAQRVVAVNLPDVSLTPFGVSVGSSTQGLILGMVQAFNGQLAAGLADVSDRVLVVDAFTVSQDQFAHPAQYGLSNVSTPVCTSPLGSLGCTSATVISGDISRHQYADDVHPTPYGYQLLTQLVSRDMARKGWL